MRLAIPITSNDTNRMNDLHHFELLIRSRIPIIAVESHEEDRVLVLLTRLGLRLEQAIFKWTVTEGLQRVELNLPPQRHNVDPTQVLGNIKSSTQAGVYVLVDFHPYLSDPTHVRLLKDIALGYAHVERTLVLLSHQLELPPDLHKYSARFEMTLPDESVLRRIVKDVANEWTEKNPRQRVKADPQAFDLLVRNLMGLTYTDAKRLARGAVFNDGAISRNDVNDVMQAKYQLLDSDWMLTFEYDTTEFSEVGGLARLKPWLELRRRVFLGETHDRTLDPPKGMLLLGVQGCGKSLAAKAAAGVFGVPLLRLDFGALYNKWHGESERNLREALKMAEVMAPCVLWLDEIEKGLSTQGSDDGTSRRILATLLTWMAERKSAVFLTATANDIERLPPELLRKGRFDEIFFVDLPKDRVRAEIFAIHLDKRGFSPPAFALPQLAVAAEGFSGAEIEQAIVSALYLCHAQNTKLKTEHILGEIQQTKPLSVVMAEKIEYLRDWAHDRTVPSD